MKFTKMNTPEKIAEISGPIVNSQHQSFQNPITHTKVIKPKYLNFPAIIIVLCDF